MTDGSGRKRTNGEKQAVKSIEEISSAWSLSKPGPQELTTQQTETIFRTVYRITRNREDAEDGMQDTFIPALKHFEDFDGRAAFSTWFTRIAINSALMILRKRKTTRTVPLGGPGDSEECKVLEETRDPAPDAEQRCLQQERETTLRDAIKELSPCLRSVVELGSLGERPMREIAQLIDVSECAAKSRLFHARAALRNSAKLHGIRNGQPARDNSGVLVLGADAEESS
jgi:RNA polymerase sigma-70 factor, ECF subfamily